MIEEKDISIIVQGPIITHSKYNITSTTTKVICQRLRKLFPKSELILSTWEGENVNDIPFDKVVFNVDPGATWVNYNDHKHLNNCNRLIVSTLFGIKSATRKYVLKVRSDLFLLNKKFLSYFDLYKKYNDNYRFVKSRIIAFSMWSLQGHKNPIFTMHRPFHISDWAYFGYKEDLLNLYDVPLIKEPEFSQWFLNNCKPFFDVNPYILWKMSPEQYITSSFLKKYTNITFEHLSDIKNDNIFYSSILVMNNFIVLDQTQFSCISLKYLCFQFGKENHDWYIYHATWLQNYLSFIKSHRRLSRLKLRFLIATRHCTILPLYIFLRLLNKKKRLNQVAAFLIKKKIKRY